MFSRSLKSLLLAYFIVLLCSIVAQSGQMLTLTERSSSSTKQHQQQQSDEAAGSTMKVRMYLHNRFQTAIDCFRGAVTHLLFSYRHHRHNTCNSIVVHS
jgi:hypothetical protein